MESLLKKDTKKKGGDGSDSEEGKGGDGEDDILAQAEKQFGADALKKWKKKVKDQGKVIKNL